MRALRHTRFLLAATLVALPASAQVKRKKILAIGEVKGYQHDSVSHALASFERWGKETDLWDTYIRTDTQLITKKKLEGNAKNLDYFDAVIFYTTGELPMDDEQKACSRCRSSERRARASSASIRRPTLSTSGRSMAR